MAKRGLTRAQTILYDARGRVNEAKQRVVDAESELSIASAVLLDRRSAYDELEKSLVVKRRVGSNGSGKLPPSPATAPPARQRSSRARSGTSSPPPTGVSVESAGIAISDGDNSPTVQS